MGEFLNDNLVDFALKRLQEELAARLPPGEFQVRPVCCVLWHAAAVC